MSQTDLPNDSQFPQVDFRAAIVPNGEYYSLQEKENKSLYMKNQVELENTKSQPDGVDAPPTALLNANQTEEQQVTFNIGEEIRYTKNGRNEKDHIMNGNFSNEVMKYNLRLGSGDEIITHATHMAHLDDTDIASIPTNPQHFQGQMQYISKEDDERLVRPTKLTALQQNILTWHKQLNHLSFSEFFQLLKFGILPKKFLALQDSQPLCASCLFGKAHRKG